MVTRSFSVYDFLVEIIPGALGLLLILSLLPPEYSALQRATDVGIFEGTLLLVVSYVIGHLIQAVVSPFDTWWMKQEFEIWRLSKQNRLYPFENLLDKGRENSEYIVVNQFLSLKGDFFEDDLTGGELFSVVQSYLWNNDIGRMRRFQILYTLFRSLWVLFLAGTILYFLMLVAEAWGSDWTVWTAAELLVITITMGVSTFLAYLRRVKFHGAMTKAMVFDFYANVPSQQD
jgi:hypothetical protein